MRANDTDITEEMNVNGEYCGACHDGQKAFGHTEDNCEKCHNGDISYASEKFKYIRKRLPRDKFGNAVDWVAALKRNAIKPRQSLYEEDFRAMPFDKMLELKAEMNMIPPAVFPHQEHVQWLDCANCHPSVFKIKKKGTQHFRMDRILKGEFCGACHLNVAFPLDDCARCHPDISREM